MRGKIALLALLSGCGVRAAPYRFAGPMVSAVRLDDPGGAPGHRHPPAVRAPMTELGGAYASHTGSREASAGLIADLPAPHLAPKPKKGAASIDLTDVRTPADLRALTGRRDGRDDLAFALAAAAAIGGPVLDAADLPGGGDATTPIVPGALLVFGTPEPIHAIAIARDSRGVFEMIYLAHGVVRRGFLDPTRPHTKRDSDGRVVNTFLRHGSDEPPEGTRYLAGELLAHVITP